jgi:CheY-like chemotaxis protein
MPKTIILIDDDQDDIDMLKEAIKEVDESAICISFTNPAEAVDLLQTNYFKPDYIFIDINMPRMTGDECLKQIRNNSELNHVEIAILSTTMPQNLSKTLSESGANFTFPKPLDFKEYFNILKNIFEARIKPADCT